jgi:hypothetical protein
LHEHALRATPLERGEKQGDRRGGHVRYLYLWIWRGRPAVHVPFRPMIYRLADASSQA